MSGLGHGLSTGAVRSESIQHLSSLIESIRDRAPSDDLSAEHVDIASMSETSVWLVRRSALCSLSRMDLDVEIS